MSFTNSQEHQSVKKENHCNGPSLAELLSQEEKRSKSNAYDENEEILSNKKNQILPINDSLTHLLVQGLQSSNHDMIQMVLQRTDPLIIKNTIINLPNEYIGPLVNEFHKFFFQKGEKIFTYILWLETLCRVKLSLFISTPVIIDQLKSLSELLSSRCEIYEKMNQLKQKLDLVTSRPEDCKLYSINHEAEIIYESSTSEEDVLLSDQN